MAGRAAESRKNLLSGPFRLFKLLKIIFGKLGIILLADFLFLVSGHLKQECLNPQFVV